MNLKELRYRKLKEFLHAVRHNKMALFGSVTLIFFLLTAVFGPIFVPFSTMEFGNVEDMLLPPSAEHLLGTDDMGRDILANLISGSRISLLIGITATAISMLIGCAIGIVSGYFGQRIDQILMRFTDFFLVIPWLPLMMVLAAVLGTSIWNIIFVIGITSWAGTARVVRAQTLSVKERQFVERTISLGASSRHIMIHHILPNVFPLVFANTVLVASVAIVSETTLSFLGLGDPSRASWGMMLHYATSFRSIYFTPYWQWWLMPPLIALIFLLLCLAFIGRDAERIVDPRLRAKGGS